MGAQFSYRPQPPPGSVVAVIESDECCAPEPMCGRKWDMGMQKPGFVQMSSSEWSSFVSTMNRHVKSYKQEGWGSIAMIILLLVGIIVFHPSIGFVGRSMTFGRRLEARADGYCDSDIDCRFEGCDQPDLVTCYDRECYTGTKDSRCEDRDNLFDLGDGGWCYDGRRDEMCPMRRREHYESACMHGCSYVDRFLDVSPPPPEIGSGDAGSGQASPPPAAPPPTPSCTVEQPEDLKGTYDGYLGRVQADGKVNDSLLVGGPSGAYTLTTVVLNPAYTTSQYVAARPAPCITRAFSAVARQYHIPPILKESPSSAGSFLR